MKVDFFRCMDIFSTPQRVFSRHASFRVCVAFLCAVLYVLSLPRHSCEHEQTWAGWRTLPPSPSPFSLACVQHAFPFCLHTYCPFPHTHSMTCHTCFCHSLPWLTYFCLCVSVTFVVLCPFCTHVFHSPPFPFCLLFGFIDKA